MDDNKSRVGMMSDLLHNYQELDEDTKIEMQRIMKDRSNDIQTGIANLNLRNELI